MIDKSTKISIGALAVCLPFVIWIGSLAWGMKERGIRTEVQLAAVVDVLKDIKIGIESLKDKTDVIDVLESRLDSHEKRLSKLEE